MLGRLAARFYGKPVPVSSQVYRWSHKEYGETSLKLAQGDIQTTFLKREARFLSLNQHPGLPMYIDYLNFKNSSVLLTQWIEGQTLSQLARQQQEVPFNWLEQIEKVLSYCHRKKFNHGDIKPANIIIGDKMAALIDFGSSIRHGEEYAALNHRSFSPSYAALAPLTGQGVAKPIQDWYSLAVTLVACQRVHPYQGQSLYQAVIRGIEPNCCDQVPSRYLQLIRREYRKALHAL